VIESPTLEYAKYFLRHLDEDLSAGSGIKLVGFVLAPAETPAARELRSVFREFHFRAGPSVHFFWAGWSREKPPEVHDDELLEVRAPKGRWYYSPSLFSDFVDDLESASKWQWSGNPTLLLTAVYRVEGDWEAELDFSRCVELDLEDLRKQGSSLGGVLERIIREGKKPVVDIERYSDIEGLRVVRDSLMEGVLKLLPLRTGEIWKRGRTYAIRDFSLR